jgi:PAS domain S-box-containing protein
MLDITERKRTEAGLRRYELLAGESRDLVFFMRSEDGRILEANAAALNAYGYSRDELLSLSIRDLRALDTKSLADEQMAIADARGILFETVHRRKDGSAFPVEVSSRGSTIDGTRTLISIVRDITERRRAEEARRESEEVARQRAEELQGLMDLIPFAVWVAHDPQCRRITGNRAAGRFYEAELDENVSAGSATGGEHDLTRRFFASDGRELLPEELPMQVAVATGKEVTNAELAVLRPSGRMMTMLGNATALFSADGLVRGCIGAFVDITERKQAEEALAERKDWLELAMGAASIGVWQWDIVEDKRVFDDQVCHLLGIDSVTFTGSSEEFFKTVHPEDVEKLKDALAQTVRDEAPYRPEYRVVWPDGTVRHVVAQGRLVHDDAGRPKRILGVLFDITERKHAEEARRMSESKYRDANARLAEADRRKDEFIAILSHELRNPLAPIRYALPLLGEERLGDAGRRATAVIDRQVTHLARLVDDLLDVSRITTGKIELRTDYATLGAVLRTAAEAASPVIAAAQHSFDIAVPDAPIWLRVDSARIAQAVTNLLNNSAKFTPKGGRIRLEATVSEAQVIIRVVDNGVGIAQDALPTVFEMFRQVKAPNRSQGGLGIGLTLTKQFVEMHGGTIEAHSAGENKGAEFVIRLPLTAPAGRPDEPQAAKPFGHVACLRVLVVDDNVDLVEMLALMVEAFGHHVRKAFDGLSAVSAALEYHPHVVLLDIGMPGMDGIDVAKELRRHPEMEGTRIVALTGWGQAEDRHRTAVAGFDEHVTEPADAERLRQVLERFASELPV